MLAQEANRIACKAREESYIGDILKFIKREAKRGELTTTWPNKITDGKKVALESLGYRVDDVSAQSFIPYRFRISWG